MALPSLCGLRCVHMLDSNACPDNNRVTVFAAEQTSDEDFRAEAP